MNLVLRKCRFVLRPVSYDSFQVLEDVDIVVEDGRIACIGDSCEKPSGFDVYDCRDKVVMPALGNAHTHAAMVSLRGYADDYELFEWLERVWRAERFLDEDVVRYGTRMACIEMAMGGIGAFQDMYYYPEVVVEEASRLGLKVRTGPIAGMHSLDPRPWIELSKRVKLYKPVINVHALYSLDEEIIEEAFRVSAEYGIDVHIHLSETRREIYLVRQRFGTTPVELLEKRGWLSERVVAIHLNWVTSWELDYLARRRSKAVLCPFSGGKLAVGSTPPIREMIDRGVVVGLGSDGACSANRLSMLTQMRAAIILYRMSYWDTRIKDSHVLYAATLGSYRAMDLEEPRLEQGAPADLIVLSLRSPWMKPSRKSRIASEVVYSAEDSDVEMTIVMGRVIWSKDQRDKFLSEVEYCEKMLHRFLDQVDSLGEEVGSTTKPPFALHSK